MTSAVSISDTVIVFFGWPAASFSRSARLNNHIEWRVSAARCALRGAVSYPLRSVRMVSCRASTAYRLTGWVRERFTWVFHPCLQVRGTLYDEKMRDLKGGFERVADIIARSRVPSPRISSISRTLSQPTEAPAYRRSLPSSVLPALTNITVLFFYRSTDISR